MTKRTIILLPFILVIVMILSIPFVFDGIDQYISTASQKASESLLDRKDFKDITILSINFKDAKLSGIDTITWQDVAVRIRIKEKDWHLSNHDLLLQADSLKIKLTSLIKKKFVLSAIGLSIQLPDENILENQDTLRLEKGLEKGSLNVYFHFDFLNHNAFSEQAGTLYHESKKMLKEGRTSLPIEFSGISTFRIGAERVQAKVSTVFDGEVSALVVDQEFFTMISWLLDEELTEPEIALLSKNPFKVPQLLNIRNKAKRKSEMAAKTNKHLPEDAYRHVLWSYLLTRKFGEEFAKRVTDAHEKGDFTDTDAEHDMDYDNNAIGREYALSGYKKEQLCVKLFKDRRIIRQPGRKLY